jgi:hypothetical protein
VADTGATSSNDPQKLLATAVPPPAERAPVLNQRAWQITVWLGLIAAGFAAVVTIVSYTRDEVVTLSWSREVAAEAVDPDWAGSTSPDVLEIVSEVSLREPDADEGAAYQAARRATELDLLRASSWATLAYLEARRNQGKVNAAALDALGRSMDACPLCDQELIRWRFNFVLANWAAIPEDLRKRAFEHADLLRWIGPHAEFLAEMRFKARLQSIPFDAYRAAVDTPARSWDIAPTSQNGRTQAPAG